jgi:hypothetical protein
MSDTIAICNEQFSDKKTSYAEQHSLVGYTKQEKDNIIEGSNVQLAENIEQVYCFIKESMTGIMKDKRLRLGRINEILANKIEIDTGINLQGYNLELRSDEIRHIYLDHGNDELEKALNPPQRAVTTEDILCFADIITNYDTVTLSTERKNGIIFQKTTGNRIFAITLHAHHNKTLSLKTLYIHI